MERLGVRQGDRIDFIGVGQNGPERGRDLRSAGIHEGTVEARSHIEKIDRIDLAEEDRNTVTSRTTLTAKNNQASR